MNKVSSLIGRGVSVAKNMINKWKFAVAVCTVFAALSVASAQTNSFPDSTVIYTGLATPFNSALSWVIGATAVLTLIGWILVAVRRRR